MRYIIYSFNIVFHLYLLFSMCHRIDTLYHAAMAVTVNVILASSLFRGVPFVCFASSASIYKIIYAI